MRERRHGQGGVLHHRLGPALYPEEFPVDLHFCAYCADDNFSPFYRFPAMDKVLDIYTGADSAFL